ncbi:protein NRT1/ PTR FAMILY 1.2-like isoform X2 [Lotus japonicus]|uniref:protein NRT1/ PTR FAMILY 1.2-like isoform X2 n=1 Tax=Lotus japonicus TaxID=34305 RepID=UPI002588B125|nr:protein NRT1/ PTR FAMILY 1.2-like isoform X2 [Lotus japonicus]
MEKEEMDAALIHEEMAQQHKNPLVQRSKGGFITMPFIIANESLAKLASVGLIPNMILYLTKDYRVRVVKATQIMYYWLAATNFTPVVGAVIADSYLGRFLAIGLGSILCFLGMAVLWLTSMSPTARPPPCLHSTEDCQSATTSQLALLLSCFALISIGGGGISCSLAFGADQLKKKTDPDNQRVLESFISWFLNKACIIKDREKDIASDGSASSTWSLCTIEQVEGLKAIIKVIPLWSSSIMISVSTSQTSFRLLQAKTMDRHITPSFEIPAGSFGLFSMVSVFITAGVYDRVILPLASKLRGKSVSISAKKRIGIGLFFSFLDFVVSAVIETIRRRRAVEEGYIDDPQAVLNMSAMWLILHHVLTGMAEAFNAIGQSEFYYSEFPSSMSSIAASLFSLGNAVGNLVASMIFRIVDDITSRGGKQSWVSDNINKGHYDKFYWLLTMMSFVNMLYYLVCSWGYGPSAEAEQGNNTNVHCEPEEAKQGSNGEQILNPR